MRMVIFALLMAGCKMTDKPVRTFKLSNGDIAECRAVSRNSCGLRLSQCKNGWEYDCQTNVVEMP